jgi:hypothetical protein
MAVVVLVRPVRNDSMMTMAVQMVDYSYVANRTMGVQLEGHSVVGMYLTVILVPIVVALSVMVVFLVED